VSVIIVTGAGGLIGAEAVRRFAKAGHTVVGVDNDMRAYFFGNSASTKWSVARLQAEIPAYRHYSVDIRDSEVIHRLFAEYNSDISGVVHAASQPSHDWAAREPYADFAVNAVGTLNLLEATRHNSPNAVFMFLSTNKVYGDAPNLLPLREKDERFECLPGHPYSEFGIDETMSIDQTKHSLFGVSKASADLMVQEYGRYFGIKSACFRGGCLTGPGHAAVELHGFLSYLMSCTVAGRSYIVYGYKGKQVRDNIHSYDLVEALYEFYSEPRVAAVYNIGGGISSNCSMLEAITACEKRAGKRLNWTYNDRHRSGDHIWWISDTRRFQADYPQWRLRYSLHDIFDELYKDVCERKRCVD
jgi:CDP-paratose 2-epimerase